jgi:DNA anti-recombination protein RmuC
MDEESLVSEIAQLIDSSQSSVMQHMTGVSNTLSGDVQTVAQTLNAQIAASADGFGALQESLNVLQSLSNGLLHAAELTSDQNVELLTQLEDSLMQLKTEATNVRSHIDDVCSYVEEQSSMVVSEAKSVNECLNSNLSSSGAIWTETKEILSFQNVELVKIIDHRCEQILQSIADASRGLLVANGLTLRTSDDVLSSLTAATIVIDRLRSLVSDMSEFRDYMNVAQKTIATSTEIVDRFTSSVAKEINVNRSTITVTPLITIGLLAMFVFLILRRN